MIRSNLRKFRTTWINTIHAFLIIYTKCSRSCHGLNQNRISDIFKNVEGFELFGDDSQPDLPALQNITSVHTAPAASQLIGEKASSEHVSSTTPTQLNTGDLQKGTQAVAFLFSNLPCPSGEENEPFTA